MKSLKNTNKLFQSSDYQKYLEQIKKHEETREFCHHDLPHFLAVARIATIKSLEADMNIPRDLIYTTALLHDIGRFVQYEDKTPHEIASHNLAISLLEPLDFTSDEKELILEAILNHRNPDAKGFSYIFYESDKLSRECLCCPMEKKCDWSPQKKNLLIGY